MIEWAKKVQLTLSNKVIASIKIADKSYRESRIEIQNNNFVNPSEVTQKRIKKEYTLGHLNYATYQLKGSWTDNYGKLGTILYFHPTLCGRFPKPHASLTHYQLHQRYNQRRHLLNLLDAELSHQKLHLDIV